MLNEILTSIGDRITGCTPGSDDIGCEMFPQRPPTGFDPPTPLPTGFDPGMFEPGLFEPGVFDDIGDLFKPAPRTPMPFPEQLSEWFEPAPFAAPAAASEPSGPVGGFMPPMIDPDIYMMAQGHFAD